MHDDLKRRLRDEVDAELGTRPPRNLPAVLTRGRSKRLALRLVTTMSVVVVGTALVAGGLSIGRELSSDDALPPANPDSKETTESSGGMWPQSSLEEVREAQRLADQGDPRYTWQVFPEWPLYRAPWKPAVEPGDVELFTRFLHEKLGWEEFSWGALGYWPHEFVVVRCAPGETNALYPNDPNARECAPTIDDNRYETVRISADQPVRDGASGVWVVTRWEMLQPSDGPVMVADVYGHQIQQMEPLSVAKSTEFLRAFLQARVDGEGAEQYVRRDFGSELYASPSGAPYERFEFELARGPVWPSGWILFNVRLFAEGGKTAEEAVIVERGEDGRLVVEIPSLAWSSGLEAAYGVIFRR